MIPLKIEFSLDAPDVGTLLIVIHTYFLSLSLSNSLLLKHITPDQELLTSHNHNQT